MSKINRILLGVTVSVSAFGLALVNLAKADYTIVASDTLPIFESGALAIKTQGIAVLTVVFPWLVGALVALSAIYVSYRVIRHFMP